MTEETLLNEFLSYIIEDKAILTDYQVCPSGYQLEYVHESLKKEIFLSKDGFVEFLIQMLNKEI